MPDSTIVVETRTSNFFSQKSTTTCSRACLGHLAVCCRNPRLGDDLAEAGGRPIDGLDPVVDVEDLALAQEFTADRRADLLLLVRADEGEHRVAFLRRVVIVDISRMPVTAISSVRGMGVADIVSTSTLARSFFSCSLCSTPNRCSSSTMTRPRSLNFVSEENRRCVPITRSTEPSFRPSRVALDSVSDWKRLSALTLTGSGSTAR